MSCTALTGIFVGSSALYVLLLALLRPLDSNLEAFLAHLNGWATLVSSILALFDDTQSTAAWIVAVQMWLAMAMLALAILQYIHVKYLDSVHGQQPEQDHIGLEEFIASDSGGSVVHQLFPSNASELHVAEVNEYLSRSSDEAKGWRLRSTTLLLMPSDPAIRERHERLREDLNLLW
jgi:hypothetical protein